MDPKPSVRSIAFFDFDETLISVDSFPHFILFRCKRSLRALLSLPRILLLALLYRLGWVRARVAKRGILSCLSKGYTQEQWQQINLRFAEYLHRYDDLRLVECMREHHLRGDEVVILTGSPTDRVEAWARAYPEVDRVIGTDMAVRNGRLTGRFAVPNCVGIEKVKRMREAYPDLDELDTFGYGDSPHDRYFLAEVKHAHYNDWK